MRPILAHSDTKIKTLTLPERRFDDEVNSLINRGWSLVKFDVSHVLGRKDPDGEHHYIIYKTGLLVKNDKGLHYIFGNLVVLPGPGGLF